ncbi:hypothetical protein GW17_00060150, partial [Ensete ventricosum]
KWRRPLARQQSVSRDRCQPLPPVNSVNRGCQVVATACDPPLQRWMRSHGSAQTTARASPRRHHGMGSYFGQ